MSLAIRQTRTFTSCKSHAQYVTIPKTIYHIGQNHSSLPSNTVYQSVRYYLNEQSWFPGPHAPPVFLTCFGVRFCASSIIKNLLTKVRPRMKLSDLILILERIKSWVAAPQSPASESDLFGTSRLSSKAPIHGGIFSSSVPGKKPISSPTGTVTRVTIISL